MILSVFAGTVALSGSAVAANDGTFNNANGQASQVTRLNGGLTVDAGDSVAGNTASSISFDFGGATNQNGVEYDGSFNDVQDSNVRVVVVSGNTIQADYTEDATVESVTSDSITVSFPETDIPSGARVELRINDNYLNPSTGGDYQGTITVQDSGTETPGTLTVGGDTGGDGDTAPTSSDDTWESSSNRWQGQVLYFSNGATNETEFSLYECTWDGGACEEGDAGFVSDISLDENGEALIDTSNLEGTYVIKTGGDPVETDANGTYLNAAPSGNPTVNIVVQSFSASWNKDTVSQGQTATMTLDSNRGSYNVSVTAEGLDGSDIVAAFPSGTASVDPDDSDAAIVMVDNTEDDFVVDFSDVDPDTYEFNVEVTDTSAADSDAIEVAEAGTVDAQFAQNAYSVPRGDIADITIDLENTDSAVVTIGSEDANYLTSVRVNDEDEDGEVTLEMNTFLAGHSNFTNQEAAFSAAGDDSIGFVDPQINQTDGDVLDATDYDLSVRVGNEETDVGVLALTEYTFTGASVYTAPSRDGGATQFNTFDDAEEVVNESTPTSEIANGDLVVLGVETNGVFGYLSDYSDIDGSNISVEISPAFQNVNDIEGVVDEPEGEVITDPDNGMVYIVWDSDDLESELDTGEEYNITFTIEDEAGLSNDGEEDDFPEASGSVQFTLVDREATFDTNADGDVQVAAASDEAVSGTTNVAPGTEFDIRLRSTGTSPFLKAETVTVQEDGTFSGSFDFSNVSEGTEFTATLPSAGFEDNSETSGVVEAAAVSNVTFEDQTTDGSSVVVASAFLPDGGFVTIHDSTLQDGAVFASVRGSSEYLEPGEHSNISVTLDTPINESGTYIAMPHMDSNGNETYDFVTSEGADDGPYTDADGNIVVDSASVTLEGTPTGTPEATPTATAEPTPTSTAQPTPTATAESTPMEQTDEPTTGQGGPGFGAVVALIALIAAALIAVRRRD